MPLDRYRQKRDFAKTPEPGPRDASAPADAGDGAAPGGAAPGGASQAQGGSAPGGSGRFVVHMHRARRLHWDLRLEIDGVLVSWAVPRGPTLDPDVRRGAFRTEDHPIEYLDFEGVIPKGEYGAGDSICWDWGTFEPETTWDPASALRDGELKFRLRGDKLRGRFTIVRTSGREDSWQRSRSFGGAGDEATGEAWLLIAKRGGETTEAGDPVAGWDATAYPASVKTGRTSDEVAAGVPPRFEGTAPAPLPSLDLPGSVRAAQPATFAPMLAAPGRAPFDDADWLFEPKWDGYRTLALVAAGRVRLITRNGNDAGRYFPELTGPAPWLMAPEAIVDGEVVALDADGRPDFSLLQGRLGAVFPGGGSTGPAPEAREAGRAAPLAYMVFDMPWCAGRSLLNVPLEDRKTLLRLVLRDHPRVRYGGHVEAEGVAFFTAAAARGLEGAMAKYRRSRYEPGQRSQAWLKLKVRPTQELVVAGFVPGQGSHRDLGALLVGVMDGMELRSVGRVGSGIDAPTRTLLRDALEARRVEEMPFAAPSGGLDVLRRTPGVVWARPELVIRAEIGGWTTDGNVRQATFVEVAADVDAASVERQDAVGPVAAARALARASRGTPVSRRVGATGAGAVMPTKASAQGEGVSNAMPSWASDGPQAAGPEGAGAPGAAGSAESARAPGAAGSAESARAPGAAGSAESARAPGAASSAESAGAEGSAGQTAAAGSAGQTAAAGSAASAGAEGSAGRAQAPTGSGSAGWIRAATGSDSTGPATSQVFEPTSAAELAALDALPATGGTWRIAGRDLRLTNLDRVLAPGAGADDAPVTKREFVRYLATIAPIMLPHLAGRALNLARWPGGVGGEFFWQKNLPKGTPDWIARWQEPDPLDRGANVHVLATETATLAWLGNQAAIEIHPWTSGIDRPAEPRWALIDIDPGERSTWEDVVVLARLFRRALDHLRLVGVPKVTGKRGIQIFIPIRPGYSFEETRGWVEAVSRAVGGAVPDLVSWEWSKDRRGGLARLDYTQNWRNRTLVGPYSARAGAGLPVSAPITWDELEDPALRPNRWTILTIGARVAAVGDLFAGALGPGQELPQL